MEICWRHVFPINRRYIFPSRWSTTTDKRKRKEKQKITKDGEKKQKAEDEGRVVFVRLSGQLFFLQLSRKRDSNGTIVAVDIYNVFVHFP